MSKRPEKQVMLPTKIVFRIGMRGIRTRLGRSLVTLAGVACGIAFLMSVASGFLIKQAMREDADRMREIQRRVASVRATIGRLRSKHLVVAAGEMTLLDRAFLEELALRRGTRVSICTRGATAPSLAEALPSADAVIALGRDRPLLTEVDPALIRKMPVMLLGDVAADTEALLSSAGAWVHRLGIELRPEEIARMTKRRQQERYRMMWIVGVSLLITVISITNALLMSVTERFREIGTMMCLGALSQFVVRLFLIEGTLTGLAGSIAGAAGGAALALIGYAYIYGPATVLASVNLAALLLCGLACVIAGVILSIIAGLYPARVAARMVPASALRSRI
ncbi:MAG: hypothetical protein CMJ18_07010 [Phycisphaeraceae bacterium]|nr:hypothetical protein [Phycisphaeraceae bacterium]